MNKKGIAAIISVILILTVVIIANTELINLIMDFKNSEASGDKSHSSSEESLWAKDRLNILVLGSDAESDGETRSDTLMVASLDFTTKEVGLLSIPRDTRVKIPGHKGYHKINAAYSLGSMKLTKKVIEREFKVPIDHYIQVDYQGFVDLIDILGGIKVNVEEKLYYIDRAANLEIDIAAGEQKLTGEEALEYVRFRGKLTGDIGRIKRQQKFLRAVWKKVLDLKTAFKLPKLIKEVRSCVKTDLELSNLLKLVKGLKDVEVGQVEMALLPGTPEYIDRVSYWIADDKQVKALIDSLLVTKSYFENRHLELTVLNGVGIPGAAGRFAELLDKKGYKVVGIANANNFDYTENLIITPPQKAEKVKKLVKYLEGRVLVSDQISNIEVIIGNNEVG